ncbi:MAG: hypothetical protein ACQETR_15705, partial [Thermodesulfobacteriota bacterium]
VRIFYIDGFRFSFTGCHFFSLNNNESSRHKSLSEPLGALWQRRDTTMPDAFFQTNDQGFPWSVTHENGFIKLFLI